MTGTKAELLRKGKHCWHSSRHAPALTGLTLVFVPMEKTISRVHLEAQVLVSLKEVKVF